MGVGQDSEEHVRELQDPIVEESQGHANKDGETHDTNLSKENQKRKPFSYGNNYRVPYGYNNRASYVSLFKNNRMEHSSRKLEFVDTGSETLEFGEEAFDSVEDTFGICLLGFVVNGRPPSAAIFDLVKRWGSNIKFQTHESGWITFTFPSVEVKERILSGGTHMIFGFHLFLKEMPRFFTFKEEDMQTLPLWVQIHGLPPVGWNHHVLSRVASKIGQPIHMDMLTRERKRVQYARVLVEMDVTKPPITCLKIDTPVGVLDVSFIYEKDAKLCSLCNKVGHASEDCQVKRTGNGDNSKQLNVELNEQHRGRPRSVVWRRNGMGPSRSQSARRHATSRSRSRINKGIKKVNVDIPSSSMGNQEVPLLLEGEGGNVGDRHMMDENIGSDVTGKCDKGKKIVSTVSIGIGKGNKDNDEDGYQKVSDKKAKKKNKKKNKKLGDKKQGMNEKSKFLEGMADSSSNDTEYVHKDQQHSKERYFGNEEKGQQPKKLG